MLWKRQKLLLLAAAATLSCAAFSLDEIPKKDPGRLIWYGTLTVGDKRSVSNETEDDFGSKLHNEAAEDTEGYQADQPDPAVGYQLAELKLRRLRPSVQCSNDSMTLRLLGRRIPDFMVERGEESPIPLSEMPSDCGLSLKRARRDILLIAKYDGCPISQQRDNYVLPLRVWGAPVKMSCPASAPQVTGSCDPSAMVVRVGVSVDALKLKVTGAWQPLVQASSICGFTLEAMAGGWIITAPYSSNCWEFEGGERLLSVQYMNTEMLLSCPVTSPSSAVAVPSVPRPPQALGDYPLPYAVPGVWPFQPTPPKSATVAPTPTVATTTKASAEKPIWYPYPYGYPAVPARSPTVAPKTTAKTTAPTATAATTTKSFVDLWYLYPNRYPPVPARSPTVAPKTTAKTAAPTTAATRAVASADAMWYPYPYGYAMPRYWPYYHGYPGAPPKPLTVASRATDPITTPTAPTIASPGLWDPFPNVYPPIPAIPNVPQAIPTVPPTTVKTTVAPAAVANADALWYPYPYGYSLPRYWPHYPGYPRPPPGYPAPPPKSLLDTLKTPDPTATAMLPADVCAQPLWNPYCFNFPRYWSHSPGYPGAPPRSTVVPPKATAAVTKPSAIRFPARPQPVHSGSLTPTKRPIVPTRSPGPATTATTVKPPSPGQLWYNAPWQPVARDPLVSMNAQSVPVSAPASGAGNMYRAPFTFYRRPYNREQSSLPVAAAAAAPFAPFSAADAFAPAGAGAPLVRVAAVDPLAPVAAVNPFAPVGAATVPLAPVAVSTAQLSPVAVSTAQLSPVAVSTAQLSPVAAADAFAPVAAIAPLAPAAPVGPLIGPFSRTGQQMLYTYQMPYDPQQKPDSAFTTVQQNQIGVPQPYWPMYQGPLPFDLSQQSTQAMGPDPSQAVQ